MNPIGKISEILTVDDDLFDLFSIYCPETLIGNDSRNGKALKALNEEVINIRANVAKYPKAIENEWYECYENEVFRRILRGPIYLQKTLVNELRFKVFDLLQNAKDSGISEEDNLVMRDFIDYLSGNIEGFLLAKLFRKTILDHKAIITTDARKIYRAYVDFPYKEYNAMKTHEFFLNTELCVDIESFLFSKDKLVKIIRNDLIQTTFLLFSDFFHCQYVAEPETSEIILQGSLLALEADALERQNMACDFCSYGLNAEQLEEIDDGSTGEVKLRYESTMKKLDEIVSHFALTTEKYLVRMAANTRNVEK